jgi:hypothetical protein
MPPTTHSHPHWEATKVFHFRIRREEACLLTYILHPLHTISIISYTTKPVQPKKDFTPPLPWTATGFNIIQVYSTTWVSFCGCWLLQFIRAKCSTTLSTVSLAGWTKEGRLFHYEMYILSHSQDEMRRMMRILHWNICTLFSVWRIHWCLAHCWFSQSLAPRRHQEYSHRHVPFWYMPVVKVSSPGCICNKSVSVCERMIL